jgi:hypothetical protein
MSKITTQFKILLTILCLTPLFQLMGQDRSGPEISLQSVIYQKDGKWHCPLCRQVVPNGDRSGWDLKLGVSEWHDVLIDKDYFHDKIRYITDEELVNSLQIKSIDPELHKALKEKDYNKVSLLLYEYFKNRPDNKRFSIHDFNTNDEFAQKTSKDTALYNSTIRFVDNFYTPEKGYTLFGVNWGKHVDFNHNYSNTSKWGVHYLSFTNHLINLYVLKHDPGIPKIFEDIFNQWYDQLDSVKHEPTIHIKTSYDVVWYELGLSNRTQMLIDAYRAFINQLSPETHKRLLKIIVGSTRWLNQCLTKTPFHPYNWQTHTSFTLSYSAVFFPELKESNSWLNNGKKNMTLHLENDIRSDGGYVERSTGYAAYMFSVNYRYMLMLEYFKNDFSLRKKYMSRLEKYIEYFALTNSPVGVNIPFNDCGRNKSLVKLFVDMAEFFNRGDFIGAVKQEFSDEELALMKVKPIEPKTKSIDFPDSRFVVMRDSWNPKSYFMMLNYGEFQNHSHFDQLDFEMYANGIPIAVDAALGKLGYIDSLAVSWYKHPLSHNMITINQAVPEKMDMPGYNKIWSPLKQTEFFAVSNDGYLKYQKAKQRRHVIFSKTKYWLIVDEIITTGKNQEMEFNFHTPSFMTDTDDGYISTQDNGFVIKQDHLDAKNIIKVKDKGWAGLGGLANEPSHREIDWLIFKKALKGDKDSDRMATLVYPFASKQNSSADVSVEKITLKDNAAFGYKVKTNNGADIIIISDGKYRKFTDKIEGDFKYVLIRFTNGSFDYADFSKVGKFIIDGVKKSFQTKIDYEYKK